VSETSSHENNARVEAVTALEMTHPVLTSSVSLPLAFPDDPEIYGRENDRVRGYEWMIGDSLLAAPLYGDDHETAARRDIYLPRGTWIDYDTGTSYDGPRMLKSFPMPVEKTPLFIGGTGIVIERRGAQLVARIYPMHRAGETIFFYPGGEVSKIRVAATHGSVTTDSGKHPAIAL
jgi:alpha-glucosidase (family GH31 glycosyl hydrolase)